jgi:hypothetical protein
MNLDAATFLAHAAAKGLTWTETAAKPPVAEQPTEDVVRLLPSQLVAPWVNVWEVGVETRSESNQRDWRARNRRTIAARKAVANLFARHLRQLVPYAEHYHANGALGLTFTRLAPRLLDRGNVSPALKAVEDAVALIIGADDGDVRWQASYLQEASPLYGVRIKLECR